MMITLYWVKPIHFRQELVKRLLLFIVSAHGIDATRLSQGIQFVNEDNTRGVG